MKLNTLTRISTFVVGIQRAVGRCETVEDTYGTPPSGCPNDRFFFRFSRRRRMLTVTGAGYTIWLIASDSIHESTRIREEEWYRVEYPTSLSKAGRDVGFFYLKWEDILQ